MKNTLILATPLLLALSTAATAAEERSGEQLFTDFGCVLCHGSTGHRGGIGGRPIAPLQHSLDTFRVLVRSPGNSMPAYAPEVLNEEQLVKLQEFLSAVVPSPEVADLELLESLKGSE